MKVYRSLLVLLAVLAVAASVYTDTHGSQPSSATNSQAVASQVSTASDGLSGGIRSAKSLLSHPVYDTQVKTYGRVSGLGEMSCPCFSITSGGERLDIWYDLMGHQAAQVPAIQNGDWVIVTGQLQSATLGLPGRAFQASHIEELWVKNK